MPCILLRSIAAVLILLPSIAYARGPLLAEQTVAQWGGPETRTRCINELVTKGFKCSGLKCSTTTWKTCTEWATDIKQHKIIAQMYGPDDISNPDEQLKTISQSCLVSGLAFAGIPAILASPFDLSTEVLREGIRLCLETQNLLAQPIAPGFEVSIETTESW